MEPDGTLPVPTDDAPLPWWRLRLVDGHQITTRASTADMARALGDPCNVMELESGTLLPARHVVLADLVGDEHKRAN